MTTSPLKKWILGTCMIATCGMMNLSAADTAVASDINLNWLSSVGADSVMQDLERAAKVVKKNMRRSNKVIQRLGNLEESIEAVVHAHERLGDMNFVAYGDYITALEEVEVAKAELLGLRKHFKHLKNYNSASFLFDQFSRLAEYQASHPDLELDEVLHSLFPRMFNSYSLDSLLAGSISIVTEAVSIDTEESLLSVLEELLGMQQIVEYAAEYGIVLSYDDTDALDTIQLWVDGSVSKADEMFTESVEDLAAGLQMAREMATDEVEQQAQNLAMSAYDKYQKARRFWETVGPTLDRFLGSSVEAVETQVRTVAEGASNAYRLISEGDYTSATLVVTDTGLKVALGDEIGFIVFMEATETLAVMALLHDSSQEEDINQVFEAASLIITEALRQVSGSVIVGGETTIHSVDRGLDFIELGAEEILDWF